MNIVPLLYLEQVLDPSTLVREVAWKSIPQVDKRILDIEYFPLPSKDGQIKENGRRWAKIDDTVQGVYLSDGIRDIRQYEPEFVIPRQYLLATHLNDTASVNDILATNDMLPIEEISLQAMHAGMQYEQDILIRPIGRVVYNDQRVQGVTQGVVFCTLENFFTDQGRSGAIPAPASPPPRRGPRTKPLFKSEDRPASQYTRTHAHSTLYLPTPE